MASHSYTAPFLRTPFTDVVGGSLNHQIYSECKMFELRATDCLEAYGIGRGKLKCLDLLEDLTECERKDKQYKRYDAMQAERAKQIKAGKLTGDNKYVNPLPDAY